MATFTSSYTAELIAILLVVKNVLYRHSNHNFTIFTDSKSALVALQGFYSNHPIILDIFYFLRRVFEKGKSITFCWSPGHVNIQGNEDADKAAKLAAARDVITFKSVPFLDTKFYSKKYIFNSFQNYWSAITTNQKLKRIKPNISSWPSILNFNY